MKTQPCDIAACSDQHFQLKVSRIPTAGIGCFSLVSIRPHTRLKMTSSGFRRLPIEQIPYSYLKYCVLLTCGRYLAPLNFHQMHAFWYTNHAKHPNTVFDGGRLIALRAIEPGDELTLYYSDLLTHPINQLWVKRNDI